MTGFRSVDAKRRDLWLAGAEVRVIQIGVERFFGDPEAAAELHRFELAGMDQPVDRHLGESENGSNFGNSQEFAGLEVTGQRSNAPWLC
jgi:hypothetical protein